jgi:chloramphenicol-sensitive protein RarD
LSLAPPHPEAPRGALAAFAAFSFWGLAAIYWKRLGHIGAAELIAHRSLWSLAFLFAVLGWQGRLQLVWDAFKSARSLGLNAATGTLLMANWLSFVWAVNNGHVLESSLGYFLVPLCNVAAGYFFFHERLRPAQWVAVALAVAGVTFLLVGVKHVPWVALTIAFTWSGYSLLRKKSPMGALDGLTVETLLYAPLVGGYLLWLAVRGQGALGHVSGVDHALVLSSGWITAIPLVWFAYAARRIRLTTLGLLQYISPSLQFLLGWLVYREPFDSGRLLAFVVIWIGLAIYTADNFWTQRRTLLRAAGMS